MSSLTQTWKTGRVLRLNLFGNDVNKKFSESLGVATTPTYVLFGPDGVERKRWAGDLPPLSELP